MKTNKKIKRLAEPGIGIYLFFLALFAAASLFFRQYYLAAAEGVIFAALLVYALVVRRRKEKQLSAYIESITYDTESAKNSTLIHFPLPIAVFRMNDSSIVWGNDMFFGLFGERRARMDLRVVDLLPEFTGKWLLDGQRLYPGLVELQGRKYQLHGNLIRSERPGEDAAFMGITYWVDVTEYDEIRLRFQNTRPVPGVIILDNFDEMSRNQPERVRNEIRDAVEDKLHHWCASYNAILRRYDRDRYLVLIEKQDLEKMKRDKFAIIGQVHQVESPTGINASLSIGMGEDAPTLAEGLQFADMAVELALTRGGDQAVIKNRLSFEFYGGRGLEVERRTKVKSRVMANTLTELVRDSSRVLVMGHRYADLDALGAAVGVCCLARKCGTKANIVINREHNAVKTLIERLLPEPEYCDAFMSTQEAMVAADGRTLLVVVDTNSPAQVEDPDLLDACNRVAVIDHHRVSASYIHNAALGFIEPYASSACELMTEILQEVTEQTDILRCEAEALLSGIVLDTKSFSIRTGERTFDAAAYLRRSGADTTEVKKLFQTDMEHTVAMYKIMQEAEQYRNIAIAAPSAPQSRVVAAKAADELLNISGVDASVVISPDGKGGVFASARSIGEINVQILMEKLGGGGNRSAAAVQMEDTTLEDAVQKVREAIDDYLS